MPSGSHGAPLPKTVADFYTFQRSIEIPRDDNYFLVEDLQKFICIKTFFL